MDALDLILTVVLFQRNLSFSLLGLAFAQFHPVVDKIADCASLIQQYYFPYYSSYQIQRLLERQLSSKIGMNPVKVLR